MAVDQPTSSPSQEGTLSMRPSSHALDRLDVGFDDDHLVADAGLLLPATLAQHLGLKELFDANVDLGTAPGRANVGHKAMTIIGSLLAGGDSIDDCDALRAGGTEAVLGHELRAPSTLGTFLRSFTFGHARQLDRVSRELLHRAFAAGAGPGAEPVTLDVDSTICETYGLAKQGGSRFTYTHVRGYHPLVAVVAGTGDVVHSRLRAGPANSGRGAGTFLTECFARVREAGATGAITVRADSGFYNRKVVGACRRAGARFSITAKMTKPLRRTIEELPEEAWVPIPYFLRRGRGGGDHVHPVHQARPDLPAHRASGPSHPRVPAGPVHRVQLPRVRDGPGGRHPSPGGRPPPPRRVREHHPGPQVRGGPEPPSFGAVRARSERDRPQPHPVGLPGRPARDPGRHRHGPPPSPGRAGACRALGEEAPPPPADELAMGRAVLAALARLRAIPRPALA